MAENVFAATQSRGDAPLQLSVRRDSLDFGKTVTLCEPDLWKGGG